LCPIRADRQCRNVPLAATRWKGNRPTPGRCGEHEHEPCRRGTRRGSIIAAIAITQGGRGADQSRLAQRHQCGASGGSAVPPRARGRVVPRSASRVSGGLDGGDEVVRRGGRVVDGGRSSAKVDEEASTTSSRLLRLRTRRGARRARRCAQFEFDPGGFRGGPSQHIGGGYRCSSLSSSGVRAKGIPTG